MTDFMREELSLIWLDSFLGLEYKHKQRLVERLKNCESITQMLEEEKEYILSEIGNNEYLTLKVSANKDYLENTLRVYSEKGVKLTTIISDNYPKQLKEIDCPPIVIYYKGDINLTNSQLFSMVGSRKSTSLSLKIAENFTESLIDVGFVLVTGIAEGVDCEVIKTALSKNKKAISVIAGGFDHIYPANNTELIDRLAENGLVISEYPPSIQPKPYHFPVRNRIIAGLSKGVLIVSAGVKSGTLYTAEYAIDYGKDLFAVPYSVGVPLGAGCNDLIKKGAILADCPDDIINFYGIEIKKENKIVFSQEEKEIINVLSAGEMHIEKISQSLKKRVFEVTTLLSMLEIKGAVVKNGNVFRLTINNLED